MTLPSFGPISLGQVRTEIEESGSISLKYGSEQLGEDVAPYSMSELHGKSFAFLSVDDDSILLNANGEGSFNIISNVSWEATKVDTGDGDAWFGINPTSGSDNGTIAIFAGSNPGNARSAHINVSATSLPDIVVLIFQPEAPPPP